MKRSLLFLVLFLSLITFVQANECTDNQGVCTLSCSASYTISNYSCAPAVSAICCTPISDFACENTPGYACSPMNFADSSMSGYKSSDYGLSISELSCPIPLNCYKKNFVVYQGAGNYTLSPGDEVKLNNGYTIKYTNYHDNSSWTTGNGVVRGHSASIQLYNGDVDYSNFGKNLVASLANVNNVDKDKIKTFSNGVYLYADPLQGDNDKVNVEIKEGILTSCTDTDAYTTGNTALETSSGSWGRNYYIGGTTKETREESTGQINTEEKDSCVDNKLTEYYCKDNELKSETEKCNCADETSCKRGFFDKISEWLKNIFG